MLIISDLEELSCPDVGLTCDPNASCVIGDGFIKCVCHIGYGGLGHMENGTAGCAILTTVPTGMYLS